MFEQAMKWIPYRPSNGTEGGLFEEKFCDQCVHDRENGCSIHVRALAFHESDPSFPEEWVIPESADEWPGDAKCTAFKQYPTETPF